VCKSVNTNASPPPYSEDKIFCVIEFYGYLVAAQKRVYEGSATQRVLLGAGSSGAEKRMGSTLGSRQGQVCVVRLKRLMNPPKAEQTSSHNT
jgi:hypothetical protein